MKAYGGVDVQIHIFLNSALADGEWSVSHSGSFIPGERAPGTHWIGGWVNPRAGLEDMEERKLLILPGLELRPLGRPARSQLVYRLRYPDSYWCGSMSENVFTFHHRHKDEVKERIPEDSIPVNEDICSEFEYWLHDCSVMQILFREVCSCLH
jgi:hypothetical protein